MKTCSLFGHRNISENIEQSLRACIITLIEQHNVTMFYLGNNGSFDHLARKILKDLKKDYLQINYAVVLAYLPGKYGKFNTKDFSDTLYPDGLENVPYRFAIPRRNRWMIDQSECLIVYINRPVGGAYLAMEYAEKKGKTIWNIAKDRC